MAQTMLPEEFLRSIKSVEGFDLESFIKVHEAGEQVVSVRFNPAKSSVEQAPILNDSERVPWSSSGYYLPSRPSFTLDPLLHAGAYYVQEASSMFLEECLKQTIDISQPLKVLDLCAAPGGKSTLIQSIISQDSLLVSNEVIKTRVNVLDENITKWGPSNNIITNNDPRDFSRLPDYFDVMVVDAPCSGSGLFRRDPSAVSEWSTDAVNACSLRQQRILTDAYTSLKKDGILIYSTCSFSMEEDEEIADWLCEKFDLTSLSLDIPAEWNITESISTRKKAYGYRFFPDKLKGEGLFVACFRKNDGNDHHSVSGRKNKFTRLSSAEGAIVSPWLKQPELMNFYHLEKEVFAFPKNLEQDLTAISLNLYTKKAGVVAGRLMKDELVPAHALALSGLVSDKLLSVSLKKEEALQYLRKEEVTIQSADKGWALVTYLGLNLGWVKLLNNRTNNYYPKEWRILKSGNN